MKIKLMSAIGNPAEHTAWGGIPYHFSQAAINHKIVDGYVSLEYDKLNSILLNGSSSRGKENYTLKYKKTIQGRIIVFEKFPSYNFD